MARPAALLVALFAASGCVFSLPEPPPHTPLVEQLLTPPKERSVWHTSWAPGTAEREKVFLEPGGAPGRTDDTPFWTGPSGTAFAGPTAENGGKPGAVEEHQHRTELVDAYDKRRAEERASADPATGAPRPEPTPGRLEAAMDAFQEYLRSRGIPPIDLSPPGTKRPEQVGP
jgi:hypothetical protein